MARIKDLPGMIALAQSGDTESAYQIGLSYDLGLGLEKDVKQSFEYYNLAAKAGHAKAQYNLAICYALSKGVAKDIKQSKYWINQARENGYSGGSGF